MDSTEIFVRKRNRSDFPEISGQRNGKDFSFDIQELGNLEENEDMSGKLHRHPHIEMIWITKGTAVYYIDLDMNLVKNDELYLVPPGHIHSLQTTEDTRGFLIAFSKEFVGLTAGLSGNGLLHDIVMDGSNIFLIRNENEKKDLENILFSLLREFRNYSLLRTEILSGWLRIFLCYLRGFSKVQPLRSDQKRNSELLNKFYALLERNFLQKKMVTDYASELFISPNYLNEIVKRMSGFTASHHIQQRIVLEAKALAVYSNLSMKEIAYLLGFEDVAYFSKYFKTFSGTNFRDFKRSRPLCDI
jgi:AraC family transcriptional regulator, transcriptional activator of pobA